MCRVETGFDSLRTSNGTECQLGLDSSVTAGSVLLWGDDRIALNVCPVDCYIRDGILNRPGIVGGSNS
jgi:hypothetical protein